MNKEEYEAEKRRIAGMTEEERKAGLERSVKGLIGDILKIVGSLIVVWVIYRAYF